MFQDHKNVHSVERLKQVYESGGFAIFDEYGEYYNWEQFEDRVINFGDKESINHLEYENGKYRSYFFQDHNGFDFMKGGDFS